MPILIWTEIIQSNQLNRLSKKIVMKQSYKLLKFYNWWQYSASKLLSAVWLYSFRDRWYYLLRVCENHLTAKLEFSEVTSLLIDSVICMCTYKLVSDIKLRNTSQIEMGYQTICTTFFALLRILLLSTCENEIKEIK